MRKERLGFPPAAGKGRKILGLTLAAVLMAASPATVMAENYTGGDNWKVTFDGSKMESTFKSSDIDDAVYKLEPGDTIDIKVALSNSYSDTTDWYMSNEVLQSLEDSQAVAEGGAYSYLLQYVSPDGSTETLYDSSTVGGDDTTGGEGLHQATDSLEDYFYLDRLASGASGEILLRVELEGETQGNAYQDTLAKLQMNFAVELVAASATTTPSPSATPAATAVKSVKTGDETQTAWFVGVALAAGVVCMALAVWRVGGRKKDEEEA